MGPFLIFKCAENARKVRVMLTRILRVFSAHSPRILRIFSAHFPRVRRMRGEYAENARESAWFPPGLWVSSCQCNLALTRFPIITIYMSWLLTRWKNDCVKTQPEHISASAQLIHYGRRQLAAERIVGLSPPRKMVPWTLLCKPLLLLLLLGQTKGVTDLPLVTMVSWPTIALLGFQSNLGTTLKALFIPEDSWQE